MRPERLTSDLGRVDLGALLDDLEALDAGLLNPAVAEMDLIGLRDLVVLDLIELLRTVEESCGVARMRLRRAA